MTEHHRRRGRLQPTHSLVSVAEAAAEYRVCERTVRRWFKAGLLESVRIGGRRLVRLSGRHESLPGVGR